MDFDLTDEQQLLASSMARFARDYDPSLSTRLTDPGTGWCHDTWKHLAELGLLGLPFAEGDGGFGGGAVETMIVMEGFGGALVREPYLATVVLAGGLLRHAGSADQRAELVPQITAGERTFAFAYTEPGSRYRLNDVATMARRTDRGWVLEGRKSVVVHGDSVDTLIVSARTAGNRCDEQGIGLFLVDANAAGVLRRGYPTQDGLRAAEIELAGVSIGSDAMLGDPQAALPAISRTIDTAIAATAAEALGAMSAILDLTVDYLKTRRQFGQPIGSFQALQHQAVEMFVELELARGITFFATSLVSADCAAERSRAMSAAKVKIGKAAKVVGQCAIQLHGAIGMTDEYKVGHYFKRLTMIEQSFGDTDHHLELLTRQDGLLVNAA